MYLVDNKNDLVNDRDILLEAGEAIKQDLHMGNFFETSVKTGDHLQEAFENMARMLVGSNRDKVLEST